MINAKVRLMHARSTIVTALITAGVAAVFVACSGPALAQAASDVSMHRAVKLGRFKVVALRDGVFQLDTRQLLIERTPGEVGRILADAHEPAMQPTSVNAFLIDTGKKRILVDTGGGSFFGSSLGKLQSGLKAAGYAPEAIDEILITHLHPDHVGGLSAGGQAVFPNAIVRLDAAEQRFWLERSNVDTVDASVKGSFDAAAASLEPYRVLGHIRSFEPGAVLDPGVSAVALPGHTPGHTAYRIESDGKAMLIWGDLMHVAPVQLKDPGVTIRFDSAPDLAATNRLAVMKDSVERRYLVAGAHLAFPGIGSFRQVGGTWQWKPIAIAPTR